MKVEVVQSPNFNARREPVSFLILHYTGMESGEAALERMCDPASEVSAHYMVWEDGRVTQLVGEDKRAWHAGLSSWQGLTDLNSRSVGIEIVNGGHDVPLADGTLPPYPRPQIHALIELCHGVTDRFDIHPMRVLGHSDIAPQRKRDPGEHFPWARMARAGIGLWPEENFTTEPPNLMGKGLEPGVSSASVERLQIALSKIGYALALTGMYDADTEAVVTAFQRRWLPEQVTGCADIRTLARIGVISSAPTD